MKKIFAILLAGILALALVSCARNDSADTDAAESVTAAPENENNSDTGHSVQTDWEEEVAGMENPWIQTTAADITTKCGNTFGVPEGAEKVVYRWCEAEEIAEMQFVCDGIEWNARMQKIPVYEDISGMLYEWEGETQTDVLPITGYLRTYHGTNEVATSILWQDDLEFHNEYMLSLSCVSDKDVNPEIAKEIFTPHQP